MPHPVLTTRALKCTVLLDPAEIEALVLVEGMPRVQLKVSRRRRQPNRYGRHRRAATGKTRYGRRAARGRVGVPG